MLDKKLTIKEFYTLSFTWGIIMTIIGLIAAAAVMITTKQKPKRNQYGFYFEVGKGCSGLSLGFITFINEGCTSVLGHEFGHSVQNCYYGPFMIIINLWSALRYWYREAICIIKHIPYRDLPDYDSIWFEGLATQLGNFYNNN